MVNVHPSPPLHHPPKRTLTSINESILNLSVNVLVPLYAIYAINPPICSNINGPQAI